MRFAAARSATGGAILKWLRRIAASVAILLALALAAALIDNNVSFRRSSPAEFIASLDQAVARSTDWALAQYHGGATGTLSTPEGRYLVSNSATAHMVVDCGSLSSDLRIKALAASFVDAWKMKENVYGKTRRCRRTRRARANCRVLRSTSVGCYMEPTLMTSPYRLGK